MIVEYNKIVGETMNQMIDRFKKEYLINNKSKIAFAGRLDPLAFGKIILLTDDDIYKKELYCGKNKLYKCTIVHGIQTDTYDIMGKLVSFKDWEPIFENIENIDYEQIYPMYSSINVIQNGMRKPLWYYETNNIKVEKMPSKEVKLFYGKKLDNDKIISSAELLNIIEDRINKVTKETFRQDEIINIWRHELKKYSEIKISKWEFKISSGGYIRYLANKMNGCCFDIERIKYFD
jgi:tRNA U55 pseudouridine synthase TruB